MQAARRGRSHPYPTLLSATYGEEFWELQIAGGVTSLREDVLVWDSATDYVFKIYGGSRSGVVLESTTGVSASFLRDHNGRREIRI